MATMQERIARSDSVPPKCVPFMLLTERQREVLQHKADGYNHSEIAGRICLSKKTIEARVRSIGRMAILGEPYGAGRPSDYPGQTRITIVGLIQDGIANGYLDHDLSGVSIKPLSQREAQIVSMLLETGKTAPQIADSLAIKLKTVEAYIEHIHLKLSIRNLYHLAARVTYLKLHDMWPEPVGNRGRKSVVSF